MARIRVFSPDESRFEEIELIVDTGSVLTWIPESLAQRLGLRPRQVKRFRTVDGTLVERAVGDAVIECEGERGDAGIVFAKPGDATVLGVTALERLGLEVDPSTGTVRKIDAYLAVRAA